MNRFNSQPSCNAKRFAIVSGLLLPVFVLVAVAARTGSSAVAQIPAKLDAADNAGPNKWALLIGIEKYHRATRLRYTINDVKQLSTTLQTRGDFHKDNILEMVDTAANSRLQPLRSHLMAEIKNWLAKPGPTDHITVYFSGHGFRDSDGRLFLAPVDCDPDNPAETGIAVAWFREQLAACKAEFKLLIIDACHAGSEKGDDDSPGVAANELGMPFEDLAGVVTLASSSSDEKSQLWDEKQQSLFSYWLTQGLKGHADRDSDGAITIDELYGYLHRTVTATAKMRFPREQTPRRIVRSGTAGVPVVVRLKPQELNRVLADMAEQMAWAMQQQRLSKVGVLEFTNDTKLGELLGADFGLLGRHCARTLQGQLMDLGTGSFSVVDERRLKSALQAEQFGIDDLGSPDALKQLSRQSGNMPAIVLGTLCSRTGGKMVLQCKLIQTEKDELAGVAGGTAAISESDWGMLGHSVAVRPEDRRSEVSSNDRPARPDNEVLIERLDQRSEGAHPLVDPAFPFRVKIMVDNKERKGVVRGNDWFVPLAEGEVYTIWIENRTGQTVLMRLLVDGLNTLPEKVPLKGVVTYQTAAPVHLGEARPWELDPGMGTEFAVRGFFNHIGKGGTKSKYREFRVVDASDSLAARQNFADEIGLITAAFYYPKADSRRIGTAAGQERTDDVDEADDLTPGNLCGLVHIRYVEPEALEAMLNQ